MIEEYETLPDKVIYINLEFKITPIEYAYGADLPSGIYKITTIDLNKSEFSISGAWRKLNQYEFQRVQKKSELKNSFVEIETEEEKRNRFELLDL